jgi:hypothetical protein
LIFLKLASLSNENRPKINIANTNVNPRVNTASGNIRRKKLLSNKIVKIEKILSRRSSRSSLTDKLGDINLIDTLKNPSDKFNYQLAYGLTSGQPKNPSINYKDIGLAKRPKSRQLYSSATVRNTLHKNRTNFCNK